MPVSHKQAIMFGARSYYGDSGFIIASFPGPSQLSVACSMEKLGEPRSKASFILQPSNVVTCSELTQSM